MPVFKKLHDMDEVEIEVAYDQIREMVRIDDSTTLKFLDGTTAHVRETPEQVRAADVLPSKG
jgi:hypothetical protein